MNAVKAPCICPRKLKYNRDRSTRVVERIRAQAVLDSAKSTMPILKVQSAIEPYRYFARPEFNIHTMAGHGENGLPNIKFVSARILGALQPDANDIVVDVGCGDGYLLARAAERGSTCIGVVPTQEEQEKLQAALSGVDFRLGLAQKLPIKSACASKVVCNSVLVLLEDERNVVRALQEISRIARPGARIWLGEVPAEDELSTFHIYHGNSVLGLLLHQWRWKGTRSFLSTLNTAVNSLVGQQMLLVNSSRLFHCRPEEFVLLAENCDLQLESLSKHTRLHRGTELESHCRYNYLFTKVGRTSPRTTF
jgi:SAM-dependent methyltransferase